MKPVVMKFGGTSVEDAPAIQRTAKIVAGRMHRGQRPVVVVSAMAKVTDQLLAAASAAGRGDRTGALAISARLRNRHCDTSALLLPGHRQGPFQNWIQQEFESIDEILRGLSAVGELTPRTNDLVVSFGERLSSRLVAEAFRDQAIPAVHVDARTCIVTDAQYGKATPNSELIEARCRQHLRPLVEAGEVPVLGGFIGSTPERVTTTLGRGGSDYTAALIGGGMDAEAIEIWTDVNGIMTADPRVCPDALRVKTISFEEAAELAYFGAKVLHPATILPAVQKNIPVLVLNSRNAANEGTRITALASECRSPFKSIAAKRKLTIIDLVASRMLMSHGYLRAVFEVFDKHKIPVDMVSTSEVSVSLTVDSTQHLPELTADLSKLADVTYEGRKALICMVGGNIRGQNGIAAQVFHAVRHINVRMISQGASEINMSFMIDEDDVDEAVRSLHAAFFVDPDPDTFDVAARNAAATKEESVHS
jgi:aspartate kinase